MGGPEGELKQARDEKEILEKEGRRKVTRMGEGGIDRKMLFLRGP